MIPPRSPGEARVVHRHRRMTFTDGTLGKGNIGACIFPASSFRGGTRQARELRCQAFALLFPFQEMRQDMNNVSSNQSWSHEFGVDAISIVISLLLVGSYYVFLNVRVRRDPTYSILAVNALARSLWVRNVMTNPGSEVMAVQTLRNFIMAGIMMASTASLLIMGTLTLSGQAENIIHSWHAINFIGSHLK